MVVLVVVVMMTLMSPSYLLNSTVKIFTLLAPSHLLDLPKTISNCKMLQIPPPQEPTKLLNLLSNNKDLPQSYLMSTDPSKLFFPDRALCQTISISSLRTCVNTKVKTGKIGKTVKVPTHQHCLPLGLKFCTEFLNCRSPLQISNDLQRFVDWLAAFATDHGFAFTWWETYHLNPHLFPLWESTYVEVRGVWVEHTGGHVRQAVGQHLQLVRAGWYVNC